MPWDNWVLDATMSAPEGMFCFCPVEGALDGDHSIVTGMNFLGSAPPNGKLVAVIHEGGQAAVDEFCAKHKDSIDKILGR
jgi:hypothetical protein